MTVKQVSYGFNILTLILLFLSFTVPIVWVQVVALGLASVTVFMSWALIVNPKYWSKP